MDETTSPEFEAALEHFKELIREYESALRGGDLGVGEAAFLRMKTAWEYLVEVAPKVGPKANPGHEMYLVLAFSCAVGLGIAAEAERLYGLLSEEERRNLDELEAHEPGRFKIWLRRR